MENNFKVNTNIKRLTCNVLSSSQLDKTEIVRILTEESSVQNIEINDDTVVIDYIAVQRLLFFCKLNYYHHYFYLF